MHVKRLIILMLTATLVLIGTTIFAFMHHEDGLSKKINFNLISHNNIEKTEKNFEDKWLFVYFGFTNCPKVCPTQMFVMKKVLQELKLSGHSNLVVPIFITVDPDRDTPKIMKNYIAHFDARIVGLTGTRKEITKVKKVFRTFSQFTQTSNDSNNGVIHSDYFYLVDPNGVLVGSYANNQDYMQLTKIIHDNLSNNIKVSNERK